MAMVLQVEFELFAETVRDLLGDAKAYIATSQGQTVVTSASPAKNTWVQTFSSLAVDQARKELEDHGMTVVNGIWLPEDVIGAANETPRAWVAAVAYQSSEKRPGLWMDAFPNLPSTSDVLTALYDEYVENGELQDLSLEEFIRIANPNVVVLTPEEICRYARTKAEEGCADVKVVKRP